MNARRSKALFRAAALALALVLCLSSAWAASDFKPSGAAEGKRLALSLLETCAFRSEYGAAVSGQDLTRWEEPIRIWVGGKPTKNDLKFLDAFLMTLSFRVPMLPPVRRVGSESEANIRIRFVKYREMGSWLSSYVEGNWGFFSFRSTGCRIYTADILIATDKGGQTARNHLMMEELVGSLGLSNDHEVYRDSILYAPWTTVQSLSEVDWLMLNMVYSPWTKPGMSWDETRRALSSRIGD